MGIPFQDRTVLFRCGSWLFVTYGMFVAAAFLWQLVGGLWYSAMAGRPLLAVAGFYLLVFWPSVVLGGRLVSALLHPRRLLTEPRRTLLQPGYMLHGGVLGGLVATTVWAGSSGRTVLGELDAIAFAAPLTESLCRLGCFVYGCCWGRPTECRLGLAYRSAHAKVVRHRPELCGVPLHPAQLYAAALHAAQFIAIFALAHTVLFDGLIVGAYLATHSVARLWLERFRADDRGQLARGVTCTAVYAVVALVLGLGFVVVGAAGEPRTLASPGLHWLRIFGRPDVLLGTGLSAGLVAAAFGLHRYRVGSWLRPSPDDS